MLNYIRYKLRHHGINFELTTPKVKRRESVNKNWVYYVSNTFLEIHMKMKEQDKLFSKGYIRNLLRNYSFIFLYYS